MTTVREILLAPKLEHYDIHLTKDWARIALASSEAFPSLDEATFAFVSELRAIAHTARLPYEMIRSMKGFYDGMTMSGQNESAVEKITNAIISKASKRIKSLNAEQLTELQCVFLEIGQGMLSIPERAVEALPHNTFWKEMFKEEHFQLSLWGSQRIAYVAIYNSYESYLTRCVGIAAGQKTYRKKGGAKFEQDIETYFGRKVLESCWTIEELVIPRLARHSLSHSAGKETDELRQHRPCEIVKEGEVQPLAHHVQKLIQVVEKAALKLIDAVLENKDQKQKR